ncbi:iron ABC transporter permease [Bacillus sp. CH30_1T]|uniref:FecCD family ABC transporter permease n=1 Tax=Bacillus sp. CH30_1T TaxID=2604836 RepID=UPI0011EE1219|nr:iron ABC transporter permease [Bacillus sp. CH30_1T]KAA0563536.1 iron ABC transporter permease [Bacillus sp. CH30_1T]
MKKGNSFIVVMVSGVLLLLFLIYVSLTGGIYELTIQQVFSAFFRLNPSEDLDLVVFTFRLPRIVLAMLIGLGLGVAGAVLQSVTKNGLADPGIVGINSGAGAAIVLFMYFFQQQVTETSWVMIMLMPLFGLIGGLVAALIIFWISWENGRLDSRQFLLTGIAIGSGFGAFTIYLSLKMNAQDFEMATVWLSGSIYSANWLFILSILPWLCILLPIILRKSYILDLFGLGEVSLIGLGVSVKKEKAILLLSCIGLVSASVSVAGSISFIGLIAPHIARSLTGNGHNRILPLSGLVGMVLVVGADFLAKTVVAPAEIPVGIVIAIIGVPYFVFLLLKVKV